MGKMLDQASKMSHQPLQLSNIKEGFKELLECQVNLLECQAKNHRMQGPLEDAILELQVEVGLHSVEISANKDMVRVASFPD